MEKLNKIQTGIAGVYLAAAELTMKGYITSITSRNTKGVDILVSNEEMSKSIGIQVKTNQGSRHWWLNEQAENYYSDNLFYVFVNLNKGENELIIMSCQVNKWRLISKKSYEEWLAKPGRKGQAHKDISMRQFQVKTSNI